VEGPIEAALAIRMGDPQSESQLLSGFHQIEHGAWRWAAHEFSVSLRAPFLAMQRGAVLRMSFVVPEAIIKLGPVTLQAKVGGVTLPPERYTSHGKHEFVRPAPPSAFVDDPVTVSFVSDRFIPPGTSDLRELALIVESIALEPVRD
jgi:hypothetical protein